MKNKDKKLGTPNLVTNVILKFIKFTESSTQSLSFTCIPHMQG